MKYKYLFIYKTTNLINNQYYIGMHGTNNLDDGYLGSGNRIKASIRKYGRSNFKKEILQFCESFEDLSSKEKFYICEEILKDPLCLNLKLGGLGGFSEDSRKRTSETLRKRLESEPEFKLKYRQIGLSRMKKSQAEGRMSHPNGTFNNKKHKKESKALMSKAKKGTGIKENNSQFGTCWIYNDQENKKINKDDLDLYLLLGWIKGRKIKRSIAQPG